MGKVKKEIELDRKKIMVQYCLAKWKISNTEVLRIQVSDKGEEVSILIETSVNVHNSAITPRSIKKNTSTQEVRRDHADVVKWRLFRLVLVIFMKIYSLFIKQN